MAWYRTGTVSVTNGSANVTGSGTIWSTQVKPGDIFTLNGSNWYEVLSVNSNTSITLATNYAGTTASGQSYAIIRNFTSTTNADLASRLTTLLGNWQNRETEFMNWQGGTVNGGPNANGTYPLTDALGAVSYVKCIARIISEVGTRAYLSIQDQKSSGVVGGTSVVGYQQRTLNTVLANNISGASVASNNITLPAGVYTVRGFASCGGTLGSRLALFNSTNGTYDLFGPAEYSAAGSGGVATIDGYLYLTAAKTYQLRHYIKTALANNGLGYPVSTGSIEVYSSITFHKES